MSHKPKKPAPEVKPKRISQAKLRTLYEQVLRLRDLDGKMSKRSKGSKGSSSPGTPPRARRPKLTKGRYL